MGCSIRPAICCFGEERPWQASHTGVSQASSPGLASPVSSSSSIAFLPRPIPRRGEVVNKAHTKSPHPHNFWRTRANAPTRGATTIRPATYYRCGAFACALTGASRRRLLGAFSILWRGFTGWLWEVLPGWPAGALTAYAPLSVSLATTGRFPSQPYEALYHTARSYQGARRRCWPAGHRNGDVLARD